MQDPLIAKLKKAGNEAMAQGDWKQAFVLFDRAVKKDKGLRYYKLVLRRGTCLEKLGLLNAALRDFATAYNLMSQAALLENVTRVSHKLHKDALPTFMEGEAAYHRGEYAKAIELYTRTIEIDASFPDAYYKRGRAHERLGIWERGIADMVKADFRFIVVDGKIKCRKAVRRMEQEQRKDHVSFKLKEMGDRCLDAKKWQEAVVHYTAALEADPEYAAPWFNRGMAYLKQKNRVAALQDLARAHKLLKRPDLIQWAADEIDKIFAKLHKKGMWSKQQGDSSLEESNWARAVWWYTRALSADASFPHAYYNRAVCREQLGLLDEATADYLQARELFKREDLVESCQRGLTRIKAIKEVAATAAAAAGVPLPVPAVPLLLVGAAKGLQIARHRSEMPVDHETVADSETAQVLAVASSLVIDSEASAAAASEVEVKESKDSAPPLCSSVDADGEASSSSSADPTSKALARLSIAPREGKGIEEADDEDIEALAAEAEGKAEALAKAEAAARLGSPADILKWGAASPEGEDDDDDETPISRLDLSDASVAFCLSPAPTPSKAAAAAASAVPATPTHHPISGSSEAPMFSPLPSPAVPASPAIPSSARVGSQVPSLLAHFATPPPPARLSRQLSSVLRFGSKSSFSGVSAATPATPATPATVPTTPDSAAKPPTVQRTASVMARLSAVLTRGIGDSTPLAVAAGGAGAAAAVVAAVLEKDKESDSVLGKLRSDSPSTADAVDVPSPPVSPSSEARRPLMRALASYASTTGSP
jgi:tetratricopeptide (TPR) repeat protein